MKRVRIPASSFRKKARYEKSYSTDKGRIVSQNNIEEEPHIFTLRVNDKVSKRIAKIQAENGIIDEPIFITGSFK